MKNQVIENKEFQEQKLQSLFQAMLSSELFLASSIVYKKLKMQVAREKITVNTPIANILKSSEEVLRKLGSLIEIPVGEKPVQAATYGSGFGNMNPAVICIEFTDNSNTETTLEIAAYGKEGLINQRTASKAIEMYIKASGLK